MFVMATIIDDASRAGVPGVSDSEIAYHAAKRRAEERYRRVHKYGGGDDFRAVLDAALDIQMLMDHADDVLQLAARAVETVDVDAFSSWPALQLYLAARIRALRSDGGGR